MRTTRKELEAFVKPVFFSARRCINEVCLSMPFKPSDGYVRSHTVNVEENKGVAFKGFYVEWSACRRSRVVCNVPTPHSLFTFTFCLRHNGKDVAYGRTTPEFLTSAMRYISKFEKESE